MEASPVSTQEKSWADRMPEIRRMVVPLLPTSRIPSGACNPCKPLPWTVIWVPLCSMSMPSARKQAMVERQSAPSKNPSSSVVPLASAPNMIPRWEMDLSPGTDISPRRRWAGWIVAVSIANSSDGSYSRGRSGSASPDPCPLRCRHRCGARRLQIHGCGRCQYF